MSVQMRIRIEPEIKEALNKFAREKGKSANTLVEEMIKNFIKERDLETYIDDLWNRIGKKLKSKDIKEGDISTAIKESRQKKHESCH